MGAFGHLVCFVLTILTRGFFLIFWILLALCGAASKRNKMQRTLEQQNELLRDIKQQNMYKNYRE